MNDAVADMEMHETNTQREPQSATPGGVAGAASGRFVYSSGARPLSGYTIRRGVGRGGFGEVYYATSDAGKEVALKLIRRNLDVELRGVRHCLNLKHPNLMTLYDIREDDQGDEWVVMEYVAGPSLEGVIIAHPEGLSADDALAWIHGIGAAVAYLHDHGIVHRDLKPGNIFSDEGLVKIGDYGLSKFISCSRRSGQTESVGTVHYMAPEIANGRYGKEIDIYALGVMLYEMLTGRVPFEGESVGEVLMKHLTAPPDVSMLEEPFRSVVARALEKDPGKRFSTVGEMLAALPRPAHLRVAAGPFATAAGQESIPVGAGASGRCIPRSPMPTSAARSRSSARSARASATSAKPGTSSKLNTPTKIVLLVVGLVVVLSHAGPLMPVAFTLLMLYGFYWVIRQIVLSPGGAKSPFAPPPVPAQAYTPADQKVESVRQKIYAARATVHGQPHAKSAPLASGGTAGRGTGAQARARTAHRACRLARGQRAGGDRRYAGHVAPQRLPLRRRCVPSSSPGWRW